MLRRNAALKIIALLLAIFLWFYRVMTEENPIPGEPIQVPVELRQVPADLAVVQSPPPAEVVVSGTKSALESAERQVSTWVSLKGADVGRHTFTVQVTVPDPLTLVRRRPERVELQLERERAKSLAVEYYFVGTPPAGYAVGEPRFQPSQVRVTGAARNVDRVAHALVTPNVAYAGIGLTRSNAVMAVDTRGDPVADVTITPAEVQVRVPVTRTRAYETVPVVPRTTGRVAKGYRMVAVEVKPPVVTIAGEASGVGRVAYVETEPLDLAGATGPISRAVRLVPPRGMGTVGAQQVTVTVEIVKE